MTLEERVDTQRKAAVNQAAESSFFHLRKNGVASFLAVRYLQTDRKSWQHQEHPNP